MEEDRKLPVWVLPALGVATVVALVVFGLNRPPVELDPASPEGTVQQYLDALGRGDFDTAASFWATTGCTPESEIPTMPTDVAAALEDVTEDGDGAVTVVVRITQSPSDLMGGAYDYQEWFRLVDEDGTWRIEQPAWPYYDQFCEETA
jgi:hypothetical protein